MPKYVKLAKPLRCSAGVKLHMRDVSIFPQVLSVPHGTVYETYCRLGARPIIQDEAPANAVARLTSKQITLSAVWSTLSAIAVSMSALSASAL